MTSSIKNTNKPLKWANQRIKANKTTYRVNKRTSSSTPIRAAAAAAAATSNAAAVMTAEAKKNPHREIERLQKELAFTYDNVATITVHFESLLHAYTCSKPELDKSKTATRLGDMEKELLTAYDDLGLQVNHLERKIAKLEERIAQLKEIAEKTKKPTIVTAPVSVPVSVPVSAPAIVSAPLPIQLQQYTSPLIYDDEMNLISSPCSSIDSAISDCCQVETSGFYCGDWALSQIIEDQTMLFNNASQFMPVNNNCIDYFNCEEILLSYPSFTMQ